jgi:hypothetical protein
MSDLTAMSYAMDFAITRLRERLEWLRATGKKDRALGPMIFKAQSLLGEIENQRFVASQNHQTMIKELTAVVERLEIENAR